MFCYSFSPILPKQRPPSGVLRATGNKRGRKPAFSSQRRKSGRLLTGPLENQVGWRRWPLRLLAQLLSICPAPTSGSSLESLAKGPKKGRDVPCILKPLGTTGRLHSHVQGPGRSTLISQAPSPPVPPRSLSPYSLWLLPHSPKSSPISLEAHACSN